MMYKQFIFSVCLLVLAISPHFKVYAEQQVFDDSSLSSEIKLPDWFKLSFLDLQDDLDEAVSANKKGLIIYFGRKDCPYCKALLDNSWSQAEIVKYTQDNFDVVAIDTKGTRLVTDFDGFVYSENKFSLKMKTNFTPSLLFYNKQGSLVFKLSGYHNPYRFLAALEYVADEHYNRKTFRAYLEQAKDSLNSGGSDELNSQPYFESPPYNLDRSVIRAERPLAVFFERKHCHACDILHAVPLEEKRIQRLLGELDVVQIDIEDKQQLISPSGVKTSGSQWARKLDLYYSPTIVFFDESGKEIIRIDSVVWFNRLERVLAYITQRGYSDGRSFQAWQLERSKKSGTGSN